MRNSTAVQQPQNQPNSAHQSIKNFPGVVVDISPTGWAALSAQECKTCDSRTYKDVSGDPSVSFQTPTHISPGQSAAVVASHESEHVSNERLNAERDGREIISQTVTLSTSICAECKRVYVSGGTTRTISMLV